MKRLQEITQQINELTMKIEREYPELYQYLDENPVTLPNRPHAAMTTKNFSDYLESLKQLLEHYIESNEIKQ